MCDVCDVRYVAWAGGAWRGAAQWVTDVACQTCARYKCTHLSGRVHCWAMSAQVGCAAGWDIT